MTGEIPHSHNGAGPEEGSFKKDFPVTASAAHYMVGLRSTEDLKKLVKQSGLPLDRVRQGGYFYMQSQLDALLEWHLSQSTDSPMPSLNGKKRERNHLGSVGEASAHRLEGTEQMLPAGTEIDLSSESVSSSTNLEPGNRAKRPRGGSLIPEAPEGLVHVDEAVRMLGMSSTNWYHTVQLKYIKVGRSRFYKRSEVEVLREQREEKKLQTKRVESVPEGYVSREEAQAIMGISLPTWYSLDRPAGIKVGRKRYFKREDIERLKYQRGEKKTPKVKTVENLQIPEGYISRQEALAMMKITGQTWYALDRPAGIKVGRKRYFKREDIEALVNRRFERRPRRGILVEGKLNLYQVLERLKISRNTFNRRVADGSITLTTEMIQGGHFYDPVEVEKLAEDPDLFIQRRRAVHVPEGYIPRDRFLELIGLTASQWGALNRNFDFHAIAAGKTQYFRESEVAGLRAEIESYIARKEQERIAARQARHAQKSQELQEAREATNKLRHERKDSEKIQREEKKAEKERARQVKAERGRPRRQTSTKTPKPARTPKPPKSESGKNKSTRTPQYSFAESKRQMARNKTREIALGECAHHYWIEFRDGVEMGNCKKCGHERTFNNTPQFTAGKKRSEPGEYRPPSEISDSDMRVLDLAFSGISIGDIATQFGYKTESVRSIIAKHIEGKGGSDGLGNGIRGILATGLFEPSFASDLDEELSPQEKSYLSAISKGLEDTFFEGQGEGFDARKLRDELRKKMGLENDIAPIVWQIMNEIQETNNPNQV